MIAFQNVSWLSMLKGGFSKRCESKLVWGGCKDFSKRLCSATYFRNADFGGYVGFAVHQPIVAKIIAKVLECFFQLKL